LGRSASPWRLLAGGGSGFFALSAGECRGAVVDAAPSPALACASGARTASPALEIACTSRVRGWCTRVGRFGGRTSPAGSELHRWRRSHVHSQTLPVASCRPEPLGGKEHTGEVLAYPSKAANLAYRYGCTSIQLVRSRPELAARDTAQAPGRAVGPALEGVNDTPVMIAFHEQTGCWRMFPSSPPTALQACATR
jgi:hypothetical protein